jgi:hypothetical protein
LCVCGAEGALHLKKHIGLECPQGAANSEYKGYTVTEEIDEVVGAHLLARMVDGVRKPTPSILLFFERIF